MSKILNCLIISFVLYQIDWVGNPSVLMKKILSCVIISVALHQTVWGYPPVLMNKILSCVIISFALFEVGYPPVLMNKTLSCVIISFALHQTVFEVLSQFGWTKHYDTYISDLARPRSKSCDLSFHLTNWRLFLCVCPVIDYEFRHNIVKARNWEGIMADGRVLRALWFRSWEELYLAI